MNNIYIPAKSPEDWIQLLADPKHWRDGHSAKLLAMSWQNAKGFPSSVKKVFNASGIDIFNKIELLFAFPEYKVPMVGGNRDSQNDIFVIAKGNKKLISIMVEGKKEESFNKYVSEWLRNSSPKSGKPARLKFILDVLKLNSNQVQNIRYQLLHRTYSALYGAELINANNALMLVHSFSDKNSGLDDYKNFVSLFGLTPETNTIVGPVKRKGVNLYFGWVKDILP